MRIIVEFTCWSPEEVDHVLLQVPEKVRAIGAREPGCICTAPEWADVLRDSCGNIVGTIDLVHDEDPPEEEEA